MPIPPKPFNRNASQKPTPTNMQSSHAFKKGTTSSKPSPRWNLSNASNEGGFVKSLYLETHRPASLSHSEPNLLESPTGKAAAESLRRKQLRRNLKGFWQHVVALALGVFENPTMKGSCSNPTRLVNRCPLTIVWELWKSTDL